jgi:hypothetical protein
VARLRVGQGATDIAQIGTPRDVMRSHQFTYDLLYHKKQHFSLGPKLIVLSL